MSTGPLPRLAAFAAGAPAPLPDAVHDKMRACLLYGLAVGIAGMRAPEPRVACAAQQTDPADPRGAIRLFDQVRVAAEPAAFANAVLMHARVQEDAHPAGHVGVVVVPAALACAERVRASGAALLDAMARGYEVALRIGRDHASALSERGFRTTSAYGPFGAAAACARLMGLPVQTTAHAIALAASVAGGLREFVAAGSSDFAFQAGIAARGGLQCAVLAAHGARAAASVLEGPAGFFRAFGGGEANALARLADRLGVEWELERIAMKPYPVCQFHRALVAGVLALRAQAGHAPATTIAVRMHPFEADFFGVRHLGPFEAHSQAFMSAPFCAALAWCRGDVTYAGLTSFEAKDVLALCRQVTVVADASRPRYGPSLTVTLADGRDLQWAGDAGDDAYRLDWPRAVAMAQKLLAEAGVPADACGKLVEAVARTPTEPDVSRVVALAGEACAIARRG